MDRLTLEDLKACAKILNTLITNILSVPFEITIQESKTKDRCFCGCNNEPIADLIVTTQKQNIIKKQGVTLYPTYDCYMPIINLDRGAKIDIQVYQTIQGWKRSIPTSFERQAERTSIVERELVERVFSPEKVDIVAPNSIL